MADSTSDFVMEERKTTIVSKDRTFCRTAHFLAPSATSINAAVSAPPAHFSLDCRDLPLQLSFPGWKHSTTQWEKWVRNMEPLHHSTWKKAGIFNAIMSSTSKIIPNRVLLYGFVEKWCLVTNTFVFPWGEATVTLEDILMVGGYSVLGDSVSISPREGESRVTVDKLVAASLGMGTTNNKKNKAAHCNWIKRFMDSGEEIEHEAFLAYWLSRFVFPMKIVERNVLPIAVDLSRGIKIALAPVVLAEIYQGLSLLKGAITASRSSGNGGGGEWGGDKVVQASVSPRLALVQVWIWERFPDLRPNLNVVVTNEARSTQWHNLRRKVDFKDLSLGMKNFEWRPYVNDDRADSSFHGKIYRENEYWALVNIDLHEELEGLIRCLRTSELVGLEANCIEQYLPHRVAMQFGMDQDVPGYVARENWSREIAWSSYNRPIIDEEVYVPPRLVDPGVTIQYFKWWNEINRGFNGTVEDGTYATSGSHGDPKVEVTKYEALVPCSSNGAKLNLHGKCSLKNSEMIFIDSDSSEGVGPPPGFSPKRKNKTERSSGESGIYKRLKDINSFSTPNGAKISKATFSENSSTFKRVAQLYNNAETKDDADVQGRVHQSSTEKGGTIPESTQLSHKRVQYEMANALEYKQRVNGVEGSDTKCDIGKRLEERMIVLGKLCDLLKLGKLDHLLMKKSNK